METRLEAAAGRSTRDGIGGSWTFDETITWSFFAAIFSMACLMPMQNDSWWHLRAGKEMWTRHFVMLSDEFSFTVTGSAWPNHEWLSEVVFYACYLAGGLPALTAFAALCVTVALAMAWQLIKGDATQRLVIIGLCMTSIVPVWTVRPHVFTLVLVMVVVHLALRRWYWPIPPIFVIWANLHGGVALGVVVLCAVLAARVYLRGLSQATTLGLVLLGAVGATFMTPLGVSLWSTIPESIHKSSVNQIVEWSFASPLVGTYAAFWLVVILLVATTFMSRHRISGDRHAVLVAIALMLLPLAIKSRRNIPPFLLIALPALSHNLAVSFAGWHKSHVAKARPRDVRMHFAFIGLCGIVCLTFVGMAWARPAPRLQWQPIPEAVIAAVRQCGDRVFNRYPDGGPLIWFAPNVGVFIDSRQDPYPLTFTQEYVALDRSGEYSQMFTRYGVQCALLPENSLTSSRLKQDGWQTRVASEGWIVLRSGGP